MSLKFEIQPTPNPTPEKERAAKLENPGFGRIFSDHMAIVQYTQGQGWHSARVESRANFPLDPAGAVLHYAQEIFEGLKAYRRDDGGVNLFRPDANAKRFQSSAERMAMAQLPADVFIEAVEQLDLAIQTTLPRLRRNRLGCWSRLGSARFRRAWRRWHHDHRLTDTDEGTKQRFTLDVEAGDRRRLRLVRRRAVDRRVIGRPSGSAPARGDDRNTRRMVDRRRSARRPC